MPTAFESVRAFFERAAERLGLEPSLREALATPTREVAVQVRVPLDAGGFAVFPGFRVQHSNARGPYKGGIRFHPRLSLDEVRTFAALMTWKTALMDIPLGGGKGGVRVDPKALSQGELERLARAYIRAIADVIGPHVDIPAPDVNTNARIMGWMADEYARLRGPTPAVITGKPVALGGSLGREAATGRGAAICLDGMARDRRWDRSATTVAIEGFGNAGRWLALVLEEMGYRVVAVSDSSGAVVSFAGLPVADAIAHKERTGSVVGLPGAETVRCEELFAVECAVLALAALEQSVTEANAGDVKAATVLEVANHPTSPDGEAVLLDRGAAVVPDILSSGGGVAVSYLEWVQNLQRETWPEDRINAELRRLMEGATDEVLSRAEREGVSLRDAAYSCAVQRVAQAEIARGFR